MKRVLLLTLLISLMTVYSNAQEQTTSIKGFLVPVCIYKGDTIASLQMPTLYIFKKLVFKNKRKQQEYNRLVRNVKKTLPIAKEVNRAIIETYEFLQTLPDDKAREKHLRLV